MADVNHGLIHERMAAILSEVQAIEKGRENTGQGYKFRGIDDVYKELHPIFVKHQVYMLPMITEFTNRDRAISDKKSMVYTVIRSKFHFVTTDGSFVECETIGEASDTGDKSSNKAMSAAQKYALLQTFLIPTEGDNDTENHSPEFVAPPALDAATIQSQVDIAVMVVNSLSEKEQVNELHKKLLPEVKSSKPYKDAIATKKAQWANVNANTEVAA